MEPIVWGWVQPAVNQGSPGDFLWGEDDFWLRNDHLGGCVIHIFDDLVPAQYWSVEIDDQDNPDGFLDLGCLFMPLGWQPSMNYEFGATFGLKNNTLVSSTLSGGKKFKRRVNPRVLHVSLPILPESEGFGQAYRFMQRVGFDRPVFVIPDPDDAATVHARSFFGTVSQMDPLTQAVVGRVGAAYEIEEII
jgi:hypothetical protein